MREAPALSAFILALGATQTIAWASSYHLARHSGGARDRDVTQPLIFGVLSHWSSFA
jgi:hypothetical protein